MARTQTSPTPSVMRDEMEDAQDANKTKTRRPPNTAFRQQRLKAWQPILTPKTVLPLFFIVGIIFAPIGGLLLYASDQVQELSIDYTRCSSLAPTDDFAALPSGRVSSSFKSSNTSINAMWRQTDVTVPYHDGFLEVPTVQCDLQFDIPNDIGPPVLLYYVMTKFHQNHRRYVKSVDEDQMSGTAADASSVTSSNCDPLTTSDDEGGLPYYPCGLIANSIFNDTFLTNLTLLNVAGSDATNSTYEMTNQGIAWSSDSSIYKKTSYTADQVVPPVNWRVKYPAYNDSIPIPDISTWEEFHVWMRTAGLPKFSKLALRNNDDVMTAGTYQMSIYDYFPVDVYGGTKSILISTRTVIGGRNPFLGIAYVIIGGICIVLGAVFTAMHLIKPRKLGDHNYLTWNNEQPVESATATGRSLRPNESA